MLNKVCLVLLVIFAAANTHHNYYGTRMSNIYTNEAKNVAINLDKVTMIARKSHNFTITFDNGCVYHIHESDIDLAKFLKMWEEK